ncbi:MAG TPA: peptidylprolyl isomerase [Acidimicrobiia bacterium]|nr:peptidylprolyl isomerase [Acidimicrobiia bacterium]
MKKVASLVVLGAFVLAACGGGSNSVAATVDGTDVTVGEVEGLIETEGATITKEQFAQFLGFAIQWQVIHDAAEADYGIVITNEDAAVEADRIFEEVGAEGETREDFLTSRGITEEFLQNIAAQGLLDIEVREILKEDVAEPTAEEIEEARTAAVSALTSVCASHILVATQEEADDVVARLDAGEDFGEIATEVSTDTGSGANGGALGCTSPDTYVDAFKEAVVVAPIGEVYEEIIETQFGFHIILVTDRTAPEGDDLPSDEEVIDGIKDEAVLGDLEAWFTGAVNDADVSVEEEFGTWEIPAPSQQNPNPTVKTVVPPAA